MAVKAVHGRMLEDYVAVLRRRWLVMVLSVLTALGLGVAYLQVADKTYVSAAKVLVQGTQADPVAEGSRTTDAVNLDTQAQLVKSVEVASLAAEQLNTPLTPVQLARRVTVAVPANTTVLEISFVAPTATQAQEGASAFADAYLDYRAQSAQDAIDLQLDSLQSEIDRASVDLAQVNEELQDDVSQETRNSLLAQREAVNLRLTSLNGDISLLRGSVVDPGEVINRAQTPKNPRDPNPTLVLPSMFFLGLLLGLVLALWRERVDERIHAVPDIDRVFGLTPLADLRVTIGSASGKRTMHYDVRALYHSLRANGPDAAEVILVVAPDSLPIANGVSRALGVVAARSGAIATYLTSESSGEAPGKRGLPSGGTLRTVHYDDVNLVHDGEVNAEQLQAQIRGLRADNDFVVLGLPSNDPNVDLPMLSRHVDVVLVLVHLGQATRSGVGDTLRSLKNSGARTVFAVSVDLRRRGRGTRHVSVLDDDDQESAQFDSDRGVVGHGYAVPPPRPTTAPAGQGRPTGPGEPTGPRRPTPPVEPAGHGRPTGAGGPTQGGSGGPSGEGRPLEQGKKSPARPGRPGPANGKKNPPARTPDPGPPARFPR